MNRRQPRHDKEKPRGAARNSTRLLSPRTFGPNRTANSLRLTLAPGLSRLADESRIAADALRRQIPDASVWIERIGFATAVEIGSLQHTTTS